MATYITYLLLSTMIVSATASENLQSSKKLSIDLQRHEATASTYIENLLLTQTNQDSMVMLIDLMVNKKASSAYKTYFQYMYNYQQIQFVGQLGIGSKKEMYRFIFDSGSSEMWLSNKSDNYAREHKSFDCLINSKSCKSFPMRKTSMHYGSGSMHGILVSDDVWVPNLKSSSANPKYLAAQKSVVQANRPMNSSKIKDWAKCKNMTFYEVSNSPGMDRLFSDGIVGIGRTDQSDRKFLWTILKEQGSIDNQWISLYYADNCATCRQSSFMIGGYDEDIVKESGDKVKWLDAAKDTPSAWTLKLDQLLIDDMSVFVNKRPSAYYIHDGSIESRNPINDEMKDLNYRGNLLLDSGTSWVFIPKEIAELYTSQAAKKGLECYVGVVSDYDLIYCVNLKSKIFDLDMPKVYYLFNGEMYTVDNTKMILECYRQDDGLFKCETKFRTRTGFTLGMPF